MKICISRSSQSCSAHWAFVLLPSVKHLLVALALTVAVCNIKGQSADQSTGRGGATDGVTVPDSWTSGANLPTLLVRAVGVFFPANGKFYAVGGRSSDTAGSDSVHPFEYNPATNTWTTVGASFPDNQVNNMACGTLTVGGTPQIYCVGGSAAGAATATARVFSYNPVADTITALTAADNWPGNMGTILPGGFAVVANKLYLIGGFNINVAMTSQTWQFDPNAAIGSRWVQRLDYPSQRGYVPTAAIGGLIYTAGGSLWDGTTLQDTADTFKYDPVANTWTAIANIPRTTAETRAVVVSNQMWVMGGGRTAPNPSNQVDIYNPSTNAWTTGLPFVTARRNFPTDSDNSRVWLAGGYDSTGTTLLNTMERFLVPVAQSAVSRKTHGGAGTFDVALPLTGNVGIECRSTGGSHTMVVTFATNVTVGGASVTSGTGSATFSVSGAVVTVNLTGVTNAQRIIVTLSNVNDGTTTGDVSIPMGVLAGDTNASGAVSAADVSQTKAQSGQTATAANFREDVNVSGGISAADIGLVKAAAGTVLPP
jgi:N-acetylneuraminic acid mutarotase